MIFKHFEDADLHGIDASGVTLKLVGKLEPLNQSQICSSTMLEYRRCHGELSAGNVVPDEVKAGFGFWFGQDGWSFCFFSYQIWYLVTFRVIVGVLVTTDVIAISLATWRLIIFYCVTVSVTTISFFIWRFPFFRLTALKRIWAFWCVTAANWKKEKTRNGGI